MCIHFIRKHLELLKRYFDDTFSALERLRHWFHPFLRHIRCQIYIYYFISKTNHQSILVWTNIINTERSPILQTMHTQNFKAQIWSLYTLSLYIDSKNSSISFFSSISQSYYWYYYTETATSRHIPASKAWLTNRYRFYK